MSATGNASSLTANASGGSRIDLSSLHVTGAKVDLSGGSWAKVNLDGRLDASVSGGSQLYYIGSPTLGSISTSGGSIVAKQ